MGPKSPEGELSPSGLFLFQVFGKVQPRGAARVWGKSQGFLSVWLLTLINPSSEGSTSQMTGYVSA